MNPLRAALTIAVAFALLAFLPVIAEEAHAADTTAFYILYGYVRQSDGSPVPDGTLVSARNIDRTDDNTMKVYTYTDTASAGRYTLTLHPPGAPTSENSMSYEDGDRIRITCVVGSETGVETHTVNVATGAQKQLDFMLEPAVDVNVDESWYENPVTVGIVVVVLIVAVAVGYYLFVPPKEGR